MWFKPWDKIPLTYLTMDLGNKNMEFIIPERHNVFLKMVNIREKFVKQVEKQCIRKNPTILTVQFFFGYYKSEKLIWTSGKAIRISNKPSIKELL